MSRRNEKNIDFRVLICYKIMYGDMLMKKTQREINPYPNSDTNKRYCTFDYYTKKTFGKKCAKLPIDAGFSCPNIDGTKGRGGCIYCSSRGAGDFALGGADIKAQLLHAAEPLKKKWGEDIGFIPYFQAHTNTYGSPEVLERLYNEAAEFEGAVAVSIATRADALGGDVLKVLEKLAEKIPVTVEVGLQTSKESTSLIINRGLTLSEFEEGYKSLSSVGVRRAVHIINGLPFETEKDMLNTASYVSSLSPDEVKIHMLYITKDAPIYDMYSSGELKLLEKDDYVRITAHQISLMPKDTVIGRLTGDAPLGELVAPLWTAKKISVLNDIDKYMFSHGLYQGM